MGELAYVNGVFGPIAEAKVSIEDRGFQFGDGIYEVIVAYDGRLFLVEQHMRRLRRSAAGIALDYDFEARPLEPIIAEGLRRSELRDALIYIQITRGAAPRSHTIPAGLAPTVVMTFKPLPRLPDELRERGARVITMPDIRWANCYIKAITLLPNVLAKNEALRRGYHDAIFVTADGEVRECTSANIFLVSGGSLLIPPRNESILHGVTQSYLIELASSIRLNVREEVIHLELLRRADEVFMSGTAAEVLAITSIDDRPVGEGRLGPITQRLYDEFLSRTRSG
ncbi:MAG: aminotransferase class IV [Planctomycetota bacterium]